jgi:hypothetical protein
MRLNIAKLQLTKPFMPPFAGNAEEVEALVQWLKWNTNDRPATWDASTDVLSLARIDQWLKEAGTQPGLAVLAKDGS